MSSVWTGFMWLRLAFSGGLLWIKQCTFRIHFKENFLPNQATVSASKERLFHGERVLLDPRGEIGCVSEVQLWDKCDHEIQCLYSLYYIVSDALTPSFCYIYNVFYFQLSLHQTRFLKVIAPTVLILLKRCNVLITHTLQQLHVGVVTARLVFMHAWRGSSLWRHIAWEAANPASSSLYFRLSIF
jgi:hypothetical protein